MPLTEPCDVTTIQVKLIKTTKACSSHYCEMKNLHLPAELVQGWLEPSEGVAESLQDLPIIVVLQVATDELGDVSDFEPVPSDWLVAIMPRGGPTCSRRSARRRRRRWKLSCPHPRRVCHGKFLLSKISEDNIFELIWATKICNL